MRPTVILLLLLLTWHDPIRAQPGFPKDSIMRVVKACTDCRNLTWTRDSSRLSYEITGGVIHRFYFDRSRTCTKYEEQYPSLSYMTPVAQYMDSIYVKIGVRQWKETLYTVDRQPIIDYAVYWSMIVLPDKKLLVVGEFRKVNR